MLPFRFFRNGPGDVDMRLRSADFTRTLFVVLATSIAASGAAIAQAPAQQGTVPAVGAQNTANPMKAPYPPFRMIGNIYYVGSAGLACYLIKTSEGEILLDTGYPDMASQIEGNVQQLGFKLSDVKILISSHAH